MQKVLVDFLGKYKERVDAEIAAEIERRLAEVKEISPHLVPVVEAMKELSVGGKRLRAMLTILGYELAGGKVNDEVIKAAGVMELFHLGLLVQDDFMDRDILRRGVRTVYARYADQHVGDSMAMLAGDITFGWGMEILARLDLPAERLNKAIGVWGKYFTRVGYGQMLDGKDIADDETILQILQIKSGEYSCVLPLLLGATLGGAKPELLENLEKYGMELGWVFQLRDDWLGMWGESAKTGKPAGEQEKKGKKTFATMHGRERAEAAIAEHMKLASELATGNKVLRGLVEWMGTREN
jgi:geranylgeranyl diphosphate synthase type I